MPRVWTWLGILALVAGAVGLADALSGPAPVSAQNTQGLTAPIPPATAQERVGSVRNKIGWTKAKERWGLNMPMGRGIPVGQVEASFKGGYLANTAHKDLPGTGFIPESGKSETSAHATTVARFAFGPDSAGQGVRAVHGYDANDWLTTGFLKTGTTDPPKDDHDVRVFNHSWVSPGHATAWRVLRRVDYLVESQDVIVVVGVNNKPGPIPAMLASAYNVISVGVASGLNSDGLTRMETEGRAKPELVAPGNKTSWSCGVVTGCAAALLEVADRKIKEDEQGRNKDAARSEVIKALLLAGAYKPANWSAPEGEPLDRKLGAGLVDLDRSLVMLEAGHVEADTETNQRYGWSFAPVGSARQRTYTFNLDQAQGDTTIALTWNRQVKGGIREAENQRTGQRQNVWDTRYFMPNLELALFRIDEQGNETQLAASTSQVDNVELIHLRSIKPGQYALRVGRIQDDVEDAWDYAVAWRIEAPGK